MPCREQWQNARQGLGFSIEQQSKASQINEKVAEKAEAGYFKNASFLLLNFVDQAGARIAEALGAKVDHDSCSGGTSTFSHGNLTVIDW